MGLKVSITELDVTICGEAASFDLRLRQRTILGTSVSLSEAEVHWREFLASLQERGMHGVPHGLGTFTPVAIEEEGTNNLLPAFIGLDLDRSSAVGRAVPDEAQREIGR
jgi:hypothetical protein